MTGVLSRAEVSALATGRRESLIEADIAARRDELTERLRGQRVLVIGGAGSIGAATILELARFPVAALHVVDLNENGLAELVRDLRGQPDGLNVPDFRTTPLDFGSPVMRAMLEAEAPYGYVLNFAAVKHVRSEKDAYSLLHMLDTNVIKAVRLLDWLVARGGTQRYFSVSTDKAANPVNLMGASKRLMEHVIFAARAAGPGPAITVSSARFANVAFSAGSLLEGWLHRLEKRQPLAVPRDTRRYFVSLREAGQLCVLAAVCAPDRHIVIPRLEAASHLVDLEGVARALLGSLGYVPEPFDDERRARESMLQSLAANRYPLLLSALDTSGEKPYEEFIGMGERAVELGLPNLLAVAYGSADDPALRAFLAWVGARVDGSAPPPSKAEIVAAVNGVVSEFRHIETHRQLDHRM